MRDSQYMTTNDKYNYAFTSAHSYDENGNIIKPRIVRPGNKDLDNEALRIISIMPNYLPEIYYGELVSKRYSLPVNF